MHGTAILTLSQIMVHANLWNAETAWNCQVSESVRSGGPTGGCCSLFLKYMTVSNQVEQSSNEVAIWPWFLKERNEHSTQIVYQYINRIIFMNVGMLTRVLAWTQTFTLLLEIGKLTWNMTEKTREPRLFAFLYPTSYLLLDPKWTQNYWNWFHKERDSSLLFGPTSTGRSKALHE
jgi:hypothetical protein